MLWKRELGSRSLSYTRESRELRGWSLSHVNEKEKLRSPEPEQFHFYDGSATLNTSG